MSSSKPKPGAASEDFYERSHWASLLAKRKPRPLSSVRFGDYRIRTYRRRSESGAFEGHFFLTTAALAFNRHGKVVGYSLGNLHDLTAYETSDALIYDLDSLDGVSFDMARMVQLLGDQFWQSRDLLYECSLTEVLPHHRKRGLGAALAIARITAAPIAGRSVAVVLQPFPLELQPRTFPDPEKSPFTPDETARRFSGLRAYWLRIFPWLRSAPEIPGSDRHFLFGHLPNPDQPALE